MEAEHRLQFESPSFGKRLKSMLGVDFYRLFHTPLFYIFLVIAAIIPAMVFGSRGEDSTGAAAQLFTNTWQMVAAQTPLYVVKNIGEYANMNMVFIFGGIMVSIFIEFAVYTWPYQFGICPCPRSNHRIVCKHHFHCHTPKCFGSGTNNFHIHLFPQTAHIFHRSQEGNIPLQMLFLNFLL